MEDVVLIFGKWKEIGGVGVALFLTYRLLVKIVEWALDFWGIKIKRKQSHEDVLSAQVAAIRVELDEVKEEVVALKGAYKFVHGIAQRAATGIEEELQKRGWESPAIEFFIGQLREVQAIEEILKD